MNILRVSADLYPSVVGGAALHAHEMSKAQARLGHNVTVYTSSEGSDSAYESAYGYNIRNFRPFVKILGNSIMPNMFIDLVKNQSHYDIIHAHSHLYFSTNLCATVRHMGSPPLVITSHGLNSQTAPKWFQEVYTATGAKFTFLSADKVICYTQTEKKELVDLGIKFRNIKIIHNGIDTGLFYPARDPSFNKKQLLWIGRYTKGKGVNYLIDAFSILKIRHPDVTLMMVGKGPDKDQIVKKIRDMGLENYIIMKDFIPNFELVNLYHNSSVFILPSLEEGVPRTILEAMSCGLPVVCSRLPQLVDIVDGSGMLVPIKDSQAFADSTSEVLSDPSLAEEFGENGRRNVVENYSWKDTVSKTVELYEELV